MIVDLFAGPGGWDEGLRLLGVNNVIGIEWDKDACATAIAAGHERIHADIRHVEPSDIPGVCTGLIASPPCQTFSQAGSKPGRVSLENIVSAARDVLNGVWIESAMEMHGLDNADPRSSLVLQPLRFINELWPDWIAFENVPFVLPIWNEYARLLEQFGYSTWAGMLNAADYGVPQARKRAFLLASRDGKVEIPTPTHSRNAVPGTQPWITMAEALNLGEEPEGPESWAWHRPATTVVRSFRPEIISAPGYRKPGDGPRQNAPGSIKVTPEQMMVLQSLRTDYPFHGSPTKRLSLIGAILPPLWAKAILQQFVEQQRVEDAA